MESVDATVRAIAEPIRREILRLVQDEELSVSEIASHFTVSRPAISQHLRVLADTELVTVRPEGTRRYFRARPAGLAELSEWMQGFWTASLRNLKTEVEREEWNNKAQKRKRRP